jgi:hypothetical protein
VVLQSAYRHLWYVCPQTVVLALVDMGMDDHEREAMARTLHATERIKIEKGKPVFPLVDWRTGEDGEVIIPSMSTFVTSETWLAFELLGLTGPQVMTPLR